MLTSLLQNTFQDTRYALRQLRRSPGFALTAVLTLALGIGATTAIFTVVRHALLQPLPYPHQQELVGIGFDRPGGLPSDEQTGATADFVQQHSRSFLSMGVADDGALSQNLSVGGGSPQAVHSLRVSAGYLPTLGIAPLVGRTFTADEDRPSAPHTAVLSEILWRGALAADPHVLGRAIHLNGDTFTVIGVMPKTLATVDAPDVWQPLHLSPADPGYEGDNFQMIARLRPGITPAQARAEIDTLNPALYRQLPYLAKWGPPGAPRLQLNLASLQSVVTGHVRSSIASLGAAVAALLLMVCLNLGGLLIARSAARRREVAVRIALGATRTALVRLLMVENLLLALCGSVLGLAVSASVVPALTHSTTFALPALHTYNTDWRAALFALTVGLLTVTLFGLLPSLRILRHSFSSASAARTSPDTVEQQRLGKLLLVSQVSVTTLLLSVGALLLGTFLNMRSLPTGVDVPGLYAAQVTLRGTHFQTGAATRQFLESVLQHTRESGLPVQAAAVNGLPLDRGLNSSGGPTNQPELKRNMEGRFITPGYFGVVGQRLLAGDDLSSSVTATSAPVALINRQAARQWFGNKPALGEFVTFGGGQPRRIIGVVADARGADLADAVRPTAYLPFAQIDDETASAINGWFPTTFVLRAPANRNLPAATLLRGITGALKHADAEVPLNSFQPMQHFIDKGVEAPRFFTSVAMAFAVFAVFLSALGTFGLLSYQVSARTREFGVRMALGSTRNRVLGLVLRRGLLLSLLGIAIGAAASLALRQIVRSVLAESIHLSATSFAGVLANASLTLAVTAATVLTAVLFAAAIPARRAASIDPTEALRSE